MKILIEEVKEIIHLATQAVYFYRKQNYIKGNMYTMKLIKHGQHFFDYAEKNGFFEGIEILFPIWKELLVASEDNNEIYLADIYETSLIPALIEINSYFIAGLEGEPLVYWKENMDILKCKDTRLYKVLKDAEENNQRKYILSWSDTGDIILSIETNIYGQVFLSSSVNPWQEAVLYGDELVNSGSEKCIIIGFGMGYHIDYIVSSSYFKEILIVESDLEQLRICMMYTDLSRILLDNRVRIVLCNQAEDYSKLFIENSGNSNLVYKIWYPSVKTIENSKIRELIENYWINTSSADNLGQTLLYNFEENQKLNDEPLDNIKDEFKNKDMVIVAAGPSLDVNIDYLSKLLNRDNIIVVCVGKIAKKLISENILPAYIVVIDGKKSTRWQTKGIEKCGVPLIYLSTAAHNLVSEYKGKRYIAYQEGVELSKKYAESNKFVAYQSGGSVATFIIDMAIRMECKNIICVGLDMGYIGDNTHAGGVGKKIQNKKSLRKVESVTGGEIYTSKTLDIYRRWIERRIENVKNIKFINSSGGARIHGMEERSLKEVTESYASQIIYCYVQEQGNELEQLIKKYSNDSLIHIYFSVIDGCEGKLLYCLCDIAGKYMQSGKESWFVTDIKPLYNIIQSLFLNSFKKIIYIEQGCVKNFSDNLDIEKFIYYFLNMENCKPYVSYMKQLIQLKYSNNLNDYFKVMFQINKIALKKEGYIKRLWKLFCETLIYELDSEDIEEKNFYYMLSLYSILINLCNNSYYVNAYLNEVMKNTRTSYENMYFVWNQHKRVFFERPGIFDQETQNINDELYNKCYYGYKKELKEYIVKIPLNERSKDLVMILTMQFLDETHAPTQFVFEMVRKLRELGKNVIIINTTEQYLLKGYLPVCDLYLGTVLEDYNKLPAVKIGDEEIPFIQIPAKTDMLPRIKLLFDIINKLKPYYILSSGNGSILADLCGNIIPCVSVTEYFKKLPKTKNKMKILDKKYCKEIYGDDDIIESDFITEDNKGNYNIIREIDKQICKRVEEKYW